MTDSVQIKTAAIPKLTGDEVQKLFESKGWELKPLADRWDISVRYVRDFYLKPDNTKIYWLDAMMGLIDASGEEDLDPKAEAILSKEEFIAFYESKGWDRESLRKRWGYGSERAFRKRIHPTPPPHFIDGVRGLPDLSN